MFSRKISYILLVIVALFMMTPLLSGQDEQGDEKKPEVNLESKEKLVVMWTSGDRDVAEKMVFMYVYNAKKRGWWKDITLIVWGPSSKLLSEDEGLQEYVNNMQSEGVIVKACQACADMYGVSDQLTKIGIDVKYMGVEFTDYIQEGRNVITF